MATRNRRFRTGIAEAVHETASGLHRIGLIDQKTMREFDAWCLTPIEPFSPEEILALRDSAGVSQGVFARYLGRSSSASGSAVRRSRAARL